MTDDTRAELRLIFESVVRAGGADTSLREMPGGAGNYHEISVFSPAVYSHPPLTAAQHLALSVLLGEPDTVIQSALADMLLDMGHEYATAVAERARAEEREKPAHLSHGSAVTVYGISGHVRDVNVSTRIDGRMTCEISVVLMTGRAEIGEWAPARSDSTRGYQFDMPISDDTD